MVDERKEILDLPTKESVATDDAFYFEIQEAVGGAGSSKKLSRAVLYAAIVAALPPMEHSSLTDLGADDHPQYHTDERGDLRYAPISIMEAADPFPQYQQADEVDAQIDSKVVALKQEADPFPQYANQADLEQAVADVVGPVAQQQVAQYIAQDGAAVIAGEVAAQLPGYVNKPVGVVSSVAGVLTLDLSATNNYIVNLTEPITDIQINNVPVGVVSEIDIDFVQDSVGGHTVALPAGFVALGGSDTTLAIEPNSVTVCIAKTKDDGATWRYAMQESASA